ncbi:MAG TPA: hypothetical protein VH134_18650 [Candidatus Dormibacteraeota bacterium]|nr:hypothetical protein [Candidatus Dormibacteraeota bacterium]
MSDPFDADELWFARLLAEVPTPGVLERGGVSPARAVPARRRRYRPLVVAGGLALLVGVSGGVGLGLTRAGGGDHAGAPATGAGSPPPRVQEALAGDDIHQVVVLFGGRGPGGALMADTWVWDGRGWSERHPLHSPTPRRGAAMSSDPAGGGVLLVGGIGSDGAAMPDNWRWDGSDWALLSPTGPPGPRGGALLAQDPVNGRELLFGGEGGTGGRSSTWTWDGAAWIRERPSDSPPDCQGSSMAYDDAFRRVVLTTGKGCTAPGAAGATWSWDGRTWSRLSPLASPPPGTAPSMAYDDATQLLVLTVPDTHGCGLVTWTWDTTGWALHADAGSPVGPASVVHDPGSRKPLLVSAAGQTWRWTDGGWTIASGTTPTPGTCPTP